MPVAEVTVQYVNQPKPGKKKGSIKTVELGYVNVWPDKLDLFFKGQRTVIEFSESQSASGGQPFLDFVRLAGEQPQGRSAPQSYNPPPQRPQPGYNPQYAQQPPPPRKPDPRLSAPATVPRQFNPEIDQMALQIFVTGLTGRAMGSGHFAPEDIDALTENAVAAFMKHLNAPNPNAGRKMQERPQQTGAVEQQYADMNDPLPDPNSYGAQRQDDEIPY